MMPYFWQATVYLIFLGEPASFDCTRCSAVLPTPDLLRMHMFSHERRDTTSDQMSNAEKTTDAGPSASMSNQGVCNFHVYLMMSAEK